MGSRSTLALVESATQLLNVIEWAHASASVPDTRVVVLAPRHEPTSRQLERVGRLARSAGLAPDTVELRRAGGGVLGDGARLVRDLARAHRVVLGDPFSRLVQTALPFARPDRIVVVDDGTATWEFRDCVDAQRPMLRWRSERSSSARAARATRLLSPGHDREVSVFSCLGDATPVGAFGTANGYAWTRARSVPEMVTGAVDIVGASLSETGVVDPDAYLAAVAGLVPAGGAARYLAHRRESVQGLARIAALPGVRVVRPDLPVELALREGPVAERVIAFPSTAAHTLPVVLAGVGVRLEVQPVASAWFTATSSPRVRRFVQRIAADAPLDTLGAA